MKSKYCPSCEETFENPENYFSVHKGKRDGLQGICRQCAKAQEKIYKAEERKKNPYKRYGLKGQELEDLVQCQILRLKEFCV